jgi:hypothetical protein
VHTFGQYEPIVSCENRSGCTCDSYSAESLGPRICERLTMVLLTATNKNLPIREIDEEGDI